MEQEEQVEERVHRPYKVMEGDKIVVRRKDIIGKNMIDKIKKKLTFGKL